MALRKLMSAEVPTIPNDVAQLLQRWHEVFRNRGLNANINVTRRLALTYLMAPPCRINIVFRNTSLIVATRMSK